MSVVIIGGNECMERQYKDLCEEYSCRAKVFTKMSGGLRNKIGSPDLLVPLALQLHGSPQKHFGNPHRLKGGASCPKNW